MQDDDLYRQLFERNPQPMWVYDLQTLRFLLVNDAAILQYGYSREEFLAMTIRDIRPPEEVARVEEAVRTIERGTRSFGVWRHRRKNGSEFDVEISGDEVSFEGRAARITQAHDVTARKQAEAETRRLGERLTATLESISDAFYTLDRDWRVTYINKAAELVMGGRAQLLGKVLWEVFPEAAGTITETSYRRAMADMVPVEFEVFYQPYQRRFEARAFPSPQGLAVYFHDITATQRAREEMRQAEERFRLLSRATNDAVWDWDFKADTLWWSDGFEALFGFSRDQVEPTIDSWTTRIHPEDRDRVAIGLHDQVAEGASVWTDDYRFLRKNGSYAFVRDRGYVVRDHTGEAVRMVGGMTDITEQRAAEEKVILQASLIDAARDAILLRDLQGRIIYWSKGAERIYGWETPEAVDRRVEELLTPEISSFREAEREVLARGAWTGELRKHARDGELLTLDCRWALLRDAQGMPTSILSIDTDITDRKRMEQLYLRAQRMESIGTLAGGVAHDLNNILTPIMMSIDLLKLDEMNPDRLEILSTIESSARQGSDLVRQVLSFARGVDGRRLEVQPANLLRDIEKMVNETFLKNIEVRTEVRGEPLAVSGDPTQLHQVLINLCVNARDAMPEGGSLSLTAENVEVDEQAAAGTGAIPGPYVCLAVEDSGTGMPTEVLERIFDPFFTTKEVGKGTGLGLSTSMGIVRSHGGFIRVYSEPGRGTTFRVYLPGHTRDLAATDAAESAAMPRGAGELILVVDDEASVRFITRQTLETFGYRVLVAGEGAEAIALYAEHQQTIDLVLTDMMMPIMDGAALIHVLRRMNPHLRIVGASGLDAGGTVARAVGQGVQHFLSKPYSAEKLLTTLKSALHQPAPARDR